LFGGDLTAFEPMPWVVGVLVVAAEAGCEHRLGWRAELARRPVDDLERGRQEHATEVEEHRIELPHPFILRERVSVADGYLAHAAPLRGHGDGLQLRVPRASCCGRPARRRSGARPH